MEKELADLSPDERHVQRLEQEKPVLDAFFGVGKCENRGAEICYLTWLLKSVHRLDLADPEQIHNLLPWNAPDECYVN